VIFLIEWNSTKVWLETLTRNYAVPREPLVAHSHGEIRLCYLLLKHLGATLGLEMSTLLQKPQDLE
jgi:hypothetical protein